MFYTEFVGTGKVVRVSRRPYFITVQFPGGRKRRATVATIPIQLGDMVKVYMHYSNYLGEERTDYQICN